jgi:parallel beta-helix repeat protein
MKRKTRPILLLLIPLLCAAIASVQSVHAAIITVTNMNDSGPGTLRQALVDANDGDTIQIVSDRPTGIQLTSGELLVNKNVSIITTIDRKQPVYRSQARGTPAFRIFHIAPGKNVTISRLVISNGFTNSDGAGIWNDRGTLTINNCRITGNAAGQSGGGIYNDASHGRGNAILAINSNSLIDGNSARDGGGIANEINGRIDNESNNTSVTINNSTVSGNSARNDGGGILSGSAFGTANTTIDSCTVSGNSAGSSGGGISIEGDDDTIISNSTISGNSAGLFGGGIRFGAPCLGANRPRFAIYDSTLSGNSASDGGGIYSQPCNPESESVIGNTILKTGASGANISTSRILPVISIGYNLSNDNGSGVLTAPGDQINTEPMLGPLQNNGGPTSTHALLPGSPAINMGDPDFEPPPNYDQRGAGYPRVVNGRIDIGAFEFQAPSRPTPTPRPEPTRTP